MKYKKLLRMFAWVTAMAVTISCADNDVEEPGLSGRENILIDVVTDEKAQTRADSHGIDSLNENKIDRLDFFFYDNIVGNNNAKIHLRVTPNTTWQYRLRREVTNSTLSSLYQNGLEASVGSTSVYVYVIANAPDNIDFDALDNTSVNALKRLAITAPFEPQTSGSTKQDNFVMDGNHTAKLVKTDGKYRLVVEKEEPILLYRAAAKIDLVIRSLKDVVEDEAGNEWIPDKEHIKVGFYHGVKNSYVNTDGDNTFPVASSDQFNYALSDNRGKDMTAYQVTVGQGEDEQTFTNYKHAEPFYSYTSQWEGETSGDVDANKEVYLTLMVPWKLNREDVTAYTNTYYQVPVNRAGKKLGRNVHYLIELNVGILGSFTEQEITTLEDNTYLVLRQLEWNQNINLDADVLDTRYLAIKYDTVYMSNTTHGVAEYITSHPSTARIDTIKWFDYSQVNFRLAVVTRNQPNQINYYTQSNNGQWTTYVARTTSNGIYNTYNNHIAANNDGTITLDHSLDDMYSPQTIVATVYHKDKTSVSEKVVFVQYPPIYLTGHKSVGRVFVNRYSYNNPATTTYSGYRLAVDDRGTGNNDYRLGNINDPTTINGSSANSNPNLYTINISSFGSNVDYDYRIGDPRSTTPETIANISRLSNYYPTSSDASPNMISPKFQVASSFGVINGNYYMNYDQAKKRCASYQEDGYPAGRWRMPTYAEVRFIMSLSHAGTIPSLFNFYTDGQGNDTEGYWVANGKIVMLGNQLQFSTNNNTRTAVRCVYDTWYWGTTHATGNNSNQPIWGDATNFSWDNYTHSDE